MNENIRAIAVVLPQFHPIPENDEWWGKGFTEWTNVTKAKPLFKGHYQPRLPSDLGFYDLRLSEAREAQAEIAKEHGISGFCYYHYWFNGKRLLNLPVDELLKNEKPDMPFMLCWANENWTRSWDGHDNDVLMKQVYSKEDDKEHIRWLCEDVFGDPRYIRVDNKPVFIIYRHQLFPDVRQTLEVFRKIAIDEFGYSGLYLCVMESYQEIEGFDTLGFDAAIEFSPHQLLKWTKLKSKIDILKERSGIRKRTTYRLTDYMTAVRKVLERNKEYKLFPSVTPSWDNTARKKENAVICEGGNPENYFYWLKNTIENFEAFSEEENFVFINAMNEWAEGNHLEPCLKYGRGFLEATKQALKVDDK